jgi:PAS domain S-box-containing protein
MKQQSDISFNHIPMDAIKDGVFILDNNGHILYVNQIIVDRSGRSKKWYLGRLYLEVIQPQDHHRVKEYFQAALEGKQIPLYELGYLNASGIEFWVEQSTTAVWKNGKISCFIGISRDINIRKQMTRKLKAAAEQLEQQVQKRTATLEDSIFQLKIEIRNRREAEDALVDYQDRLEEIVDHRTDALKKANEKLGREIAVRKQIEIDLRKRENELAKKADHLLEANIALKVLMDHKRDDLKEMEDKVLFNVRELVLPYLEKMKRSRLDEQQRVHLNLLEINLNWIVKPLKKGLRAEYIKLTPTEIQVANMVKHGKSTKRISEMMHLSPRTVEFHRDNIRKKFGIKKKKINLRSYLLTSK